ncbi:MAG: hypothetical protein A2Y22_03510 [Clostridiales bacterium GWD2_32_59]|nr:MAG: hypothetical protein A2Y18_00560 [Clostridiales bacterium GWD2_32_19]OGO85868.1 MAG: hypothetical protein A2Y22_03510 [Clostridiales bacterium GWD2_32_59]
MKEVMYMISGDSIKRVREGLQDHVGSKVVVKCNRGKRRTTVNQGVLESTHSNVFVVRYNNQLDETYHRTSYSYTDLLTKSVEFSILRDSF